MKGLLIKDFKLLQIQKKFFIALILLSLVTAFSGNDSFFVLPYLALILPSFALSTISYDEFDNGSSFLFTLPISRKGYVAEKYLFSVILGVIALVLGIIVALSIGAIQKDLRPLDILKAAPLSFAVMLLALSVMLPLQLKFGSEKGRIAKLLIFGGAVALIFATLKLFPTLGTKAISWLNELSTLNIYILVINTALIILAIFALSIIISIRIMEKKEF